MKIEIMIPSCLVIFIVFFFLIGVGRINYQETTKEKFKFKSHFPYEMQDNVHYKYNWHMRFMTLFFALSLSLFAVNAFEMEHFSSLSFATFVMILNAIVIMLLFIVNMKNASMRMILSIAHFLLTFLSYAFVINYVFFYNAIEYPKYLGYVVGGILVLIVILLVNPRLYRWMYLDSKEENGEKTLIRPKVVLLPYYEWIFIVLTIFLDLLITVVTVLM